MSGLSGALGPPFVQGAGIRDVFNPTALWDNLLFRHQVFNFIHIKLSKSPLLWIFQHPENLNFTCSVFCSLVQTDIMTWPMWTLAIVPWRPLLLLPSVFPSIRDFSNESWLFTSGGQSIGASALASVLPMNIQD